MHELRCEFLESFVYLNQVLIPMNFESSSTSRRPSLRMFIVELIGSLFLVSLLSMSPVVGQEESSSKPTSQTESNESQKTLTQKTLIETILTEQTKAWNEGDLEKFMQTYWRSEKLTFSSGGKTTYGWEATLDNYKRSYPTVEKMGKLHFDGLEISMIESKSALVLGNFHLTLSDDSKVDGNFSLVVKKMDEGWKIIHDHSSGLDEKFKKKKDKKKD